MINDNLHCDFPCIDVDKNIKYPLVDLDPMFVKLIMISEAPSIDITNYFYKDTSATFFQTTITAFQDAGIHINSYKDLTNLGIYLTTAIKCSKKDYLVSSQTIKNCSRILEKELLQFPNIKVIMCMGDFAIKSINFIYKNRTGKSPIKSGSTYKIRKEKYELNGIRFIPSYTQTGDSFNIEKSKRRMIAEDIKNAIDYLNKNN